MKKLILLLTIIILSCSKDDVKQLELWGSINFNGTIPSEFSKVPTCKDGTPTKLTYNIRQSDGYLWILEAGVTENNGTITTTEEVRLPFGTHTVEEIYVSDDTEILYALPNEDELDLLRYSDVTTPFNILVDGDSNLSGTMLCYTPQELPEGIFGGAFDAVRLETLWFYPESECVDHVTIEVDAYRILDVFIYETGIPYEVAFPEEYNLMYVRAYSNGVLMQSFLFNQANPYNPDGIIGAEDVIVIDPDCN